MQFTLQKLGATAPTSTTVQLKPGYEWFQYVDAAGKQLRTCPSLATQAGRGCYMINGLAWGQRPNVNNEFSSTTAKTLTPPQQYDCNKAYLNWLAANPTYYTCATWPTAKNVFVYLCGQANSGALTRAGADQLWHDYIAKNCPATKPPAPPPPQTPPKTSVPPPSVPKQTLPTPTNQHVSSPPLPPLLQDPSGGPSDGGAGGDTAPTPPVAQKSLLRQVGPVVGIGLLVAVGLTYARKKFGRKGSLTKQGRHR